jgi:uncharacterized protein YlxP (DUF503 family)
MIIIGLKSNKPVEETMTSIARFIDLHPAVEVETRVEVIEVRNHAIKQVNN